MYLESYYLKFKQNDNLDWFLIGCIISIAWALSSVIYPAYFVELGLSDETIGFILTLRGILTLLFSFVLISLLEKFNHVNLIFYTTFPLALIFLSFVYLTEVIIIIFLFLLQKILIESRGQAKEIEFRNSTDEKHFSELRGLFQAVQNLFWIILPFLGGLLLEYYGYNTIFILTSVLILISGLLIKFLNVKTHQKK